jgi:hypothetical protein
VRPFAKASSAGSTRGDGNSRGLFRSALVTRGASSEVKGSGAPSSRRAPIALTAALAAIACLAFSAAPALAAPPTVTTPVVSEVSYASAHLTGEITSDGGLLNFTSYAFQYSTDPSDPNSWKSGPEAEGEVTGAATDKTVEGKLSVPNGGTEYFVRLVASVFGPGFAHEEGVSPEPNPSFTTLAVDPPVIVATDDASEVFSESASATGIVKRPSTNTDHAFDISACRFEWVSDAEFTATGFATATSVPCDQTLPFEGPEGETHVTAHLTGLEPSTTYHLRLAAENAAPGAATKEASSTFTTPTKVAKPTVLTADDATEVTKRTAKVSGSVERPEGTDPALDTSCRFEYVTEEQFTTSGFEGAGQTPCVQAPPEAPLTSPGPASVSAELSGLASSPTGVTYHLRLAAENGGGTDTKGAVETFTTLPIVPPTVTVDSITEVGYTSFRVTGTSDPGNQGAFAWFEYSPADTEEWSGDHAGFFPLLDPGSPARQISMAFPCLEPGFCGAPLKPGTTYKVRGVAREQETFGNLYSAEPYTEFTTKGTDAPPSATLDAANEVTGTTAHLTGTVDPHAPAEALNEEARDGYRTEWRVECSPACPGAPSGTVEGGEGAQPIDLHLHNLETNTIYQVKLIAENLLATVESDQTFETPLVEPSVKSLPGGSDSEGGYILAGVVNPNHSEITSCEFKWGPSSAGYAFGAPCSPTPGAGNKPVSVEAHLTGLEPGVHYHADLVVNSDAFGEDHSGDFEFIPTRAAKEPCPNEQLREETDSLGLPECRAYETWVPSYTEGFPVGPQTYSDDGAIAFESAGAFAGNELGVLANEYVATRTPSGWSTTSPDPPAATYSTRINPAVEGLSSDLRSSLWISRRNEAPADTDRFNYYLRGPDGSLTRVGPGEVPGLPDVSPLQVPYTQSTSADLSHILFSHGSNFGTDNPALYEFVGIGNAGPAHPVSVDNDGHELPGPCPVGIALGNRAIPEMSADGRVIVFGSSCTPDEEVVGELWARVGGSASVAVSGSECTRTSGEPGGACNAPTTATYAGMSGDGSRVYFTSIQQLVNGDTDRTNDLYECEIPSGQPAPAGTANPCASLTEVSGTARGANVQNVVSISEDGSHVYFVARAVLATNLGIDGAAPAAGDENLYVWEKDTAHPVGRMTFVTSLEAGISRAQSTTDGRYLIFDTAARLLESDTDGATDVYRYDAQTGVLLRLSINSNGTGGNGLGFDAEIPFLGHLSAGMHVHPTAMSADAGTVIFETAEALSPADTNTGADVYEWHEGQVSLIGSGGAIGITPSGRDIFFGSRDARIGGGFATGTQAPCSGETCQPPGAGPPAGPAPVTTRSPAEPGNVKPRTCPKGKKIQKGRCVKKHAKKHKAKHQSKKKSHSKKAKGRRAGSKHGGRK